MTTGRGANLAGRLVFQRLAGLPFFQPGLLKDKRNPRDTFRPLYPRKR